METLLFLSKVNNDMYIPKVFNGKDAVRIALLASSLFLISSVLYAIYIHAQFSNEITKTRTDLADISKWYTEKAGATKDITLSREYKNLAAVADTYANNITGPMINPYAYTYLNYWIVSSGFVDLDLNWEELGLSNSTSDILYELEARGWFGNANFTVFDPIVGDYVQKLAEKPNIHADPIVFYTIVFLVVLLSTYIGTKEDYEVDIAPEVIYGVLALIPFWIVYLSTVLITLSGLFKFLEPSQVVIDSYLTVIVITIVLSAFSGMIAGAIKMRKREE